MEFHAQLQHDVETFLRLIEVLRLYETRLQETRSEEKERKDVVTGDKGAFLYLCFFFFFVGVTHVVDPLQDVNLRLCVSCRRL